MSNQRTPAKNRPLPAILAAFGITFVIGCLLAALAANALLTPTPALASAPQVSPAAIDAGQAGQLQQLSQQYQAREQQYADLVNQYKAREQQLNQQIQQLTDQRNAAQGQAQQYAQILGALQQAGLIQITADGQIFINQPGAFTGEHDRDHD